MLGQDRPEVVQHRLAPVQHLAADGVVAGRLRGHELPDLGEIPLLEGRVHPDDRLGDAALHVGRPRTVHLRVAAGGQSG